MLFYSVLQYLKLSDCSTNFDEISHGWNLIATAIALLRFGKSGIGRRDLRLHHWTTTLRRFGRLLGNTPVSNRALSLSAAVPSRRRKTERHPSVSFCALQSYGASRTKFCWGFQRLKRVRTIASKTVRKDPKAIWGVMEWERKKKRERERKSREGRRVRRARVV